VIATYIYFWSCKFMTYSNLLLNNITIPLEKVPCSRALSPQKCLHLPTLTSASCDKAGNGSSLQTSMHRCSSFSCGIEIQTISAPTMCIAGCNVMTVTPLCRIIMFLQAWLSNSKPFRNVKYCTILQRELLSRANHTTSNLLNSTAV
jgi:hypothetical protein